MAATVEGDPDLTLRGVATEADHETYIEAPFKVPAGVTRLTITFDYPRAQRTVLDLGLLDQERFRGWSGGERLSFTLSAEEATASYLLGPIVPGRWTLLIGVPNIRKGVTAAYEAKIWFGRGSAPAAGFDLFGPAAEERSRLVARRSPHAHGPQRRLLLRPERDAGAGRSTAQSRRQRREGSISSPSPTTTPPRISTPCASCSPPSTACCSFPAARSPPSSATPTSSGPPASLTFAWAQRAFRTPAPLSTARRP